MSVFGPYSRYYNLFYKDKDYPGEVEYVNGLICRHSSGVKSLLDLGCGTGSHSFLLAEKGYEVTGVDMSPEMLDVANSRLARCGTQSPIPSHQPPLISFQHGDIRSVRLGKTFDVVISLFHVMSYQVSNSDLRAAFATARSHLRPEGVFIFDCWYGPAVLTDRPAVRVKRLEDEAISVTRIAEPVMQPDDSLVDVNYQVFIRDKASGVVEELRETHRMRYLFRSEVEMFSEEYGLSVIESAEWMTGKQPGFDTWGVCYVVRG